MLHLSTSVCTCIFNSLMCAFSYTCALSTFSLSLLFLFLLLFTSAHLLIFRSLTSARGFCLRQPFIPITYIAHRWPSLTWSHALSPTTLTTLTQFYCILLLTFLVSCILLILQHFYCILLFHTHPYFCNTCSPFVFVTSM